MHHLRIGEGALKKANQLAVALRSTRSGGRLALAAFVTVPVWLLVFGFYALLAREMGLPRELSFAEATFGSSLAVMFNLLPINAMAGVGTQELGWVTGFNKLLGVDESVALSTGIGCHVIQLFNVVAMGIVAHLLMGVMPRLRFDPIDKLPAG